MKTQRIIATIVAAGALLMAGTSVRAQSGGYFSAYMMGGGGPIIDINGPMTMMSNNSLGFSAASQFGAGSYQASMQPMIASSGYGSVMMPRPMARPIRMFPKPFPTPGPGKAMWLPSATMGTQMGGSARIGFAVTARGR